MASWEMSAEVLNSHYLSRRCPRSPNTSRSGRDSPCEPVNTRFQSSINWINWRSTLLSTSRQKDIMLCLVEDLYMSTCGWSPPQSNWSSTRRVFDSARTATRPKNSGTQYECPPISCCRSPNWTSRPQAESRICNPPTKSLWDWEQPVSSVADSDYSPVGRVYYALYSLRAIACHRGKSLATGQYEAYAYDLTSSLPSDPNKDVEHLLDTRKKHFGSTCTIACSTTEWLWSHLPLTQQPELHSASCMSRSKCRDFMRMWAVSTVAQYGIRVRRVDRRDTAESIWPAQRIRSPGCLQRRKVPQSSAVPRIQPNSRSTWVAGCLSPPVCSPTCLFAFVNCSPPNIYTQLLCIVNKPIQQN